MKNYQVNPIYIFYTKFEKELPPEIYDELLDLLPNDLKLKNSRYVRWQDRHAHLFGKLLLIEGIRLFGYSETELYNIEYNKFDRPFLNENFDFNISHSGEYVIFAITKKAHLGIDIEQIRKIEFSDFLDVMSAEQWQEINKSSNSDETFFRYWTIKESVIKADSRGLSIPLQELHVQDNKVYYDNRVWHINRLSLDSEYSACLATNVENVDISFKYIDFNGRKRNK